MLIYPFSRRAQYSVTAAVLVFTFICFTDESTSDASSFFICTKSAPALNSQHAAFGFVVYGADLIDDIAAVKINADQSPTSTITITSISFAKLPK